MRPGPSNPSQCPPNAVADVIIVGGGPVGLSAALILARARRRVVVLDSGDKRNEPSKEMHAVLGSDGAVRADYLTQAREQVLAYPTVQFHPLEVEQVDIASEAAAACSGSAQRCCRAGSCTCPGTDGGPAAGGATTSCAKARLFQATAVDGSVWRSRKLVLATGMRDLIPPVAGFEELFGHGVSVCPYCDGYERRDRPLGAYGNGERGVHLALEMLCWSRDVTLFTDGEQLEATEQERAALARHGVLVVRGKLAGAYADDNDRLAGVELQGGERVTVRALYFNTGRFQGSALPESMGLHLNERGDIKCDSGLGGVPEVPGLFVAGNISQAPLQLVVSAAAQGAAVGAQINSQLMDEDLGLAGCWGALDKHSDRIQGRECGPEG